jgi:hypothetical protein
MLRWLDDIGEKQNTERQRRRIYVQKAFEVYLFRFVGSSGKRFVWELTFYGLLKLYSGPIFRDTVSIMVVF